MDKRKVSQASPTPDSDDRARKRRKQSVSVFLLLYLFGLLWLGCCEGGQLDFGGPVCAEMRSLFGRNSGDARDGMAESLFFLVPLHVRLFPIPE